ncbi:hypothetical protein H1R20_g7214, partial [Candolleomyces eurysporus]
MFKSIFSALAIFAVSVSAITLPPHLPRNVNENLRRAPGQVVTSCTVPNTAALTFDDGPWVYLYDISKALVAAGAVGTFFFNGDNFGDCIYTPDQAKRVKYAYDKGHQVASHTWAHKNLTTLNWDQIHHEMWLAEEAIFKITGAYPAFVRPRKKLIVVPFVDIDDQTRQHMASTMACSRDWALGADEVKQLYTDLAKRRPSNVLTLNHEVHQHSAQVVLPHAIKVLKDAGYRLVSLAECLGQPAYTVTGPPTPRDATWTCQGK